MDKLASLLNVEPGEGRLVALLFLHSFLLGMANNFVQTAAFALFMTEFDAQTLALVYVATALVVPLLTFVYLRLGQRLSFSHLLLVNLGFLLLLVSAFRLGLGVGNASAVVFALPILFQVLATFGNLEFWTLANRLLNVRQGKRLFGLVGAGLWLAIVLTGLLIPFLVAWLGTANLLFLSAGAVAGALGLVLYISRAYGGQLAAPAPRAPAEKKRSSANLLKNRYVLLIFVLVILWWLAFFFVDNIFYDRAAAQFPGEQELASFLGIYLAVLGVLTLLSNTFFTGPVISRFGVQTSLLILPIALLAGSGSMAVLGTVAAGATLLFLLTVGTKLLDLALGFSIDLAARNILYQPLPADQRSQTQTMADGIFMPVANGLAGVVLLALGALFASRLPVVYGLFFIVAAWLAVAVLVGREYPAMLIQALAKRRLGGADLSLTDASSLDVLERELHSPHPGVVVYALSTLESIEHESLPAFLQEVLTHPAPEVRQYALQRIEGLGLTSALPAVHQRVTAESVPSVQGAALRTYAALGEAEAFEEISGFLEASDPRLRQGAMVGLLRSGGIEGVLAAGLKLLQMADSPEPAERIAAAQVLGEVGLGSFYQPLVPLLRDPDSRVQRAALLQAGRLRNRKLWPLVLDTLDSPHLWRAAAATLVAAGTPVVPQLIAASEREGRSLEVQARLIEICGRIGGQRATAWLKGQLSHPDAGIRSHIVHALHRCDYQAQAEEAALVQQQIQVEVARSAETLAILKDIGNDGAVQLLRQALDETLAQDRERIFFLLSFLCDRRAILQACENLALPSAEKRAYALEVIDVLIPRALKGMVFPLLTDLPPGQKGQQLWALFPQPQQDRLQRLREIIAGPAGRFNPWTQACALYAAGELSATAVSETAAAALFAPEPLVRETAAWTLSKLDGPAYRDQILALRHDPSPQVAQMAGQWDTDRSQEEMMLTTIEKVLALKKASVFAETPDEILAEVATLLAEVPLSAGDTVIEQGDLGDCMYFIVNGEVRVHEGEHTLDHLAEGDVFGEMALLDAEPRMASVTAAVDTLLLRLDQEPFFELMDDRPEVARGIIRVLLGYLRTRAQDVNELRARLEMFEGE
jgi:AAA family ATP:ADP antiporter